MEERDFQRLEAPPAEATAQYLNASMESLQNKESDIPAQEAPMQLSNHWTRYFVTELVGTYIATLCMDYTLYTLSAESYEDLIESGFLFMALGIAASYFFGVLIAWDANLNAAFTFALALCRVKPWKMVPIIIVAQLIGAVCAHSMFYYMIGYPDLDSKLAFCFGVTPPPDAITNSRIVWSSIWFMTILMLALLPVFAPELGGNANISHSSASMIVGLIIAAFVIPGTASGAQSNPTGFFSAFITMWFLGFDSEYFHVHDNYWWTALVGPFLGVIVALTILCWLAVITWNEPRDWKKAYLAMLAGPQ